MANKFGVTLTFIATRSGLTRFEDHWIKNSPGAKTGGGHSSGGSIDSPDEGQALPEDSYEPIAPTSAHSIPLPEDPEVDDLDPPEPEQPGNGAEFGEKHNRATDEPFYKRAVDFHLVDESAFVYSVPFGIGRRPDAEAEVTASRAIFVGQGQERAPAAVVGLRMRLQTFGDKFFNSSHRCERGQCANVCQRWSEQSNGIDPNIDSYRCVLIDNNGYVVVDSGSHSSVGRLMIELDAPLFNTLVDAGVYRSVRMFDYQSMCIELLEKPQLVGSGSGTCRAMRHSFVRHSLQSIFWLWIDLAYNWHETLVSAATSVWSQMSSAYQDVTGQDQFAADQSDSSEPPSVRGMAKDSKGKLLPPNRTRPFPCDKQFTLYDLQPSSRSELASRPMRREYVKCDDCQQ